MQTDRPKMLQQEVPSAAHPGEDKGAQGRGICPPTPSLYLRKGLRALRPYQVVSLQSLGGGEQEDAQGVASSPCPFTNN